MFLEYPVVLVNVTVSMPDELASRAASAAADRGLTVEELASEALEVYLERTPTPSGRVLSFLGLGDAPNGFSARAAEARLETEGFDASRSS